MIRRMPQTSTDFLQGVITAAFASATMRTLSDSSFNVLKEGFQALIEAIKLLREKEEEKLRLQSKNKTFQRNFEFSETEEQELHAMEPPTDYRELAIVPSVQELMSKAEVFLRPNLRTGAYIDANHYQVLTTTTNPFLSITSSNAKKP